MSFAKSELKELTTFELTAALTMKCKPRGKKEGLTWLGPSFSSHTSLCAQETPFESVLTVWTITPKERDLPTFWSLNSVSHTFPQLVQWSFLPLSIALEHSAAQLCSSQVFKKKTPTNPIINISINPIGMVESSEEWKILKGSFLHGSCDQACWGQEEKSERRPQWGDYPSKFTYLFFSS